MVRSTILAVALCLGVDCSLGQSLSQSVYSVTEVQIGLNGGVYDSCGVRAVVFPGSFSFPMRIVDYSIVVYADKEKGPIGAAKFTALILPTPDAMQKKQTKEVLVADAWLKPEGPIDLPPIATAPIRGDNPNALLVLVDPLKLLTYLTEIGGEAQRALVGVKAKDDKVTQVIAHRLELREQDRESFRACMGGLLERITARHPSAVAAAAGRGLGT